MAYRLLFLTTLTAMALGASAQYIPKFDVQGHRGARGLKPENTIPAFLLAIDSGVTTIELDVVVTKDKEVVVSHEPWMSAAICLDPAGSPLQRSEEHTLNSSHSQISYAVFCLKKKKNNK